MTEDLVRLVGEPSKAELIKKLSDLNKEPELFEKLPVQVFAVELDKEVQIQTREGTLMGYPGDFVIEGINKEIYPCGREIFFKTYKKV